MREFTVTCTTCHAPLRVRDESLVGQIVACPKCGSMVLIEPPPIDAAPQPFAAVSPPTVAPPSLFDTAIGDVLKQAESQSASGPASAEVTRNASDKVESHVARTVARHVDRTKAIDATAAPTATEPLAPRVESATPRPRGPAAEVPEASAPDASALDASVPQTVDATPNRLRSILLTVAAGMAGIVLALGLALAAIALFSQPDRASTGTGTPTSSNQGARVANASSPPGDLHPSGSAANAAASNKPDASNSAGQPAVSNKPADKPADKPTSVPADDNGASPAKPATDPAKPAPVRSPPVEAVVPILPPVSPDAGDKPTRPLAGRPDPAGPPSFAPKPLADRVMPEPVAGAFSRLLPGAIPTIEKPTEPTAPGNASRDNSPPPEIPGIAPPGAAPPPSEVSRPRPREIDVQARMADPIAKFEVPGIPLADLVQLLSDLSTVPMTLDADALRVRRIDPWAPVSVKVQDATVRSTLTEAIQPLKLGLVVHDASVVISHPIVADSPRRTMAHDLADLDHGDEAEREWLAQTLTELVAPDQWTDAGGPHVMRWENGKLTIEADESVHYEVLLLCDKLRAARKLPQRGKYASALVAPDSVATRAAKSLAEKVTLNFNRPARLGDIAHRLGKAAGIRVLVDWHELVGDGWTAETTATLSVEDLSLDQALEKLLAPRELAYRVVDDATLQITTAAATERYLDVELHSVAGALAADGDATALLERLYDKLGSRRFRSFGGSGVLRYDTTSRCVVALLPWRHQVELSRALAAWSAPPAE